MVLSQDQHRTECLLRWQALEQEARQKWADFRRKRITRRELEGWLKQCSEMDERTIRGIYNGMRG
ncbi:hypothetical protein NLU14_08665 [Marinobacter sp. 71-i]|uniref:Uncharacterized protein n=1 Tax=Marinobacter iranensis TaxID=2962607 RepID=A0ABT5Y9E1_9GAMM|nr:hypothetical protein [Marinobacter iranensis]MDF0750301.1 hypothetical protein [Marinobacter iranensis]